MTRRSFLLAAAGLSLGAKLEAPDDTTLRRLWAGIRVMDVDATAYCPCDWCCGTWRRADGERVELVQPASGLTASGYPPIEGQTLAADWSVLPKGTLVYLEGLGLRIVTDSGGEILGNRVDVYKADHDAAVRFGRRSLKLAVVEDAAGIEQAISFFAHLTDSKDHGILVTRVED